MMKPVMRALCALLAMAAAGCTPYGGGAEDSDWPSYGLDDSEQRFSPLEQINADTVADLGLAWSLDLPVESRALEATPLAVDGTLYFTTSMAVTYAVDAVTGK